MDLTPTEDQLALHGLAREVAEGCRDAGDTALLNALGQSGLIGAAVPESAGGLGMGAMGVALIGEALGATGAGSWFPALATTAWVLAVGGRTDLVRRLIEGTSISSLGLLETVGSPLAPAAAAIQGSDGFHLTGTKIAVPLGEDAEHLIVAATASEEGPGLFLLSRAEDVGIRVRRQRLMAAVAEAEIDLDGARAEARLGGVSLVRGAVELHSMAQCALLVGICDGALRLTAGYTKERVAFGRPIAAFQAVGQRLADAYVAAWAAELTTREAAWTLDAGLDAARVVATARATAVGSAQTVIKAAHHLHGGIGMDRSYALHRFTTLAKHLELTGGGVSASLVDLGERLARTSGRP